MNHDIYSPECVCGHHEDRHLRVSGLCRGARCKCDRFVNNEYLDWLQRVAENDLWRIVKWREELHRKLKLENGGES